MNTPKTRDLSFLILNITHLSIVVLHHHLPQKRQNKKRNHTQHFKNITLKIITKFKKTIKKITNTSRYSQFFYTYNNAV